MDRASIPALSLIAIGVVLVWGPLSSCCLTPLTQRYPTTTCPDRCFPNEDALSLTDLLFLDEDVELPFDLTGVWAQQEISSSLSDAPLVGVVETTTTDTLLVRMDQSGNRVEMVVESCGMDSLGSSSAAQVTIPQSYIDAMDPGHRSAVIEPWEGGYRIRQERFLRVLGAELDDIENEPLPVDADDPRVVDHDGDGNPGVTVLVDGLLSGEIYLLQRSWIELCGDVITPNRLEGFVRWGMDQSVVDASNLLLDANADSIPNPDWNTQRFVSCRLDQDMTCEELFANRETVFAECDRESGNTVTQQASLPSSD